MSVHHPARDIAVRRDNAVLVIIDFQERLAAIMPDEPRAQAEHNIEVLVEAAHRFDIPVVVSQQYPRGLGSTIAPLEKALDGLGQVHRFDKVDFSACDADDFPKVREALGDERNQWILTGMETHICVYQTARELAENGAIVHVPRDAVVSREKRNFRVGLDLMNRAGGIISSTETVLFDLLGRAGTDDFKALAKLIK